MANIFPSEYMELTHILVVRSIEASRIFYKEVLGAEVVNEYGGTSCVLKFLGAWLLLVTGGEPTEDKPDVTFTPPADIHTVSHSMTIRVHDCYAAYETLLSKGVKFITPPKDWGAEVRCFFRDPDGHLLEISQLVSEH